MHFHILLIQHNEGFAVSCPSCPGCFSQGETLEEALENIKDAMWSWNDVKGVDVGEINLSYEFVEDF